MFFEPTRFPWLAVFQTEWKTCLNEFDSVGKEDLVVWPEPLFDSGRWLVFGLYGFGERINSNCDRCPYTAKLVGSVPGLYMAGYSVLEPGTRIRPHFGYSGDVLRAHLGLRIPLDCGIRVGGDMRSWQVGEWLVFDDTKEHEAWNLSDEDRVVLLIDFLRPDIDEVSKLDIDNATTQSFATFQLRNTGHVR